MRICAAWLLKHAAPPPTSYSPDLVRKAIGFYERAVQLDPNFAIAWARLSRADALLYFNSVDTATAARRRCSETCFGECAETGAELGLKPCSPWVIINTGCCVITGLPKPRSSASAKCYQAAARCQWPSA